MVPLRSSAGASTSCMLLAEEELADISVAALIGDSFDVVAANEQTASVNMKEENNAVNVAILGISCTSYLSFLSLQ
jgi:ribosomal protein S8E